jgi:hypothetical protein
MRGPRFSDHCESESANPVAALLGSGVLFTPGAALRGMQSNKTLRSNASGRAIAGRFSAATRSAEGAIFRERRV